MKKMILLGSVTLVLGAAIIRYGTLSFTTAERSFQLGSYQIDTERTKTIVLPALLGWILIAGGALLILLIVARFITESAGTKKDDRAICDSMDDPIEKQ